jgi:hypothetical protein
MRSPRFLGLLFCGAHLIWAGESIHISGIVTDVEKKPVKGAIVQVEKTSCSDTTDDNGAFRIQCIPVAALNDRMHPSGFDIRMVHNSLTLTLSSPEHAAISLFDMNGRYMGLLASGIFPSGTNKIPFGSNFAVKTYILRCIFRGGLLLYKMIPDAQLCALSPTRPANKSADSRFFASAMNKRDVGTIQVGHDSFALEKAPFHPLRDTSVSITLVHAHANWVFALDSECVDQNINVLGMRSGNYMAVGLTHSPSGNYNTGIATLDASGFALSKGQYGGPDDEIAYEFGLDSRDEARIYGTSGSRLMAMHVSQNGDSMNTVIVQSNATMTHAGGAVLSDDGYVVAGYSGGLDSVLGRNIAKAKVIRFSSTDDSMWQKEYEIHYYTICRSIIALQKGGFMLAGTYYDTVERDTKIYLLRLDDNGGVMKQIILKDLKGAFLDQMIETMDNKVMILCRAACNARECPYMARLSPDCTVEWDSVMTDPSYTVNCMTNLPDGTIVLGCRAIPIRGSDTDFEFEGIKLLNITTSGKVLRQLAVSDECGHPESISFGKDGSIIIASATGYTFLQQKFYITNVTW